MFTGVFSVVILLSSNFDGNDDLVLFYTKIVARASTIFFVCEGMSLNSPNTASLGSLIAPTPLYACLESKITTLVKSGAELALVYLT